MITNLINEYILHCVSSRSHLHGLMCICGGLGLPIWLASYNKWYARMQRQYQWPYILEKLLCSLLCGTVYPKHDPFIDVHIWYCVSLLVHRKIKRKLLIVGTLAAVNNGSRAEDHHSHCEKLFSHAENIFWKDPGKLSVRVHWECFRV